MKASEEAEWRMVVLGMMTSKFVTSAETTEVSSEWSEVSLVIIVPKKKSGDLSVKLPRLKKANHSFRAVQEVMQITDRVPCCLSCLHD